MNIICKNINDFYTLITTCSLNGINNIRVFISQTSSYPNVRITTTPKDHIKFTFALLTPLYTAIYSDNVKNSEYDKIYDTLEQCQYQCNNNFRIQVFDKLEFKSDNNLYIGTELNVI